MARLGKIGVYSEKTRKLQRKLSYEAFGLSWKTAEVYKYLGDRSNDNPSINDINTTVFNEVPDRAYESEPKEIPIGMEPLPEHKTDFSRFGLIDIMQNETRFRVHIDDFETIGREIIIGDIFAIPFFSKGGKRAFWEISDVDLKHEHEKFIAIIHASPLQDKRETREIPFDRSNESAIGDIINQMEDEQSKQVPAQELSFDGDKPEEKEVDYRTHNQTSFLDDPNKSF